jgi:hypothetical protein
VLDQRPRLAERQVESADPLPGAAEKFVERGEAREFEDPFQPVGG